MMVTLINFFHKKYCYHVYKDLLVFIYSCIFYFPFTYILFISFYELPLYFTKIDNKKKMVYEKYNLVKN